MNKLPPNRTAFSGVSARTATEAISPVALSVTHGLDIELNGAVSRLLDAIIGLEEKLHRALRQDYPPTPQPDEAQVEGMSPLAQSLVTHRSIVDGATSRIQSIIDRQQIG